MLGRDRRREDPQLLIVGSAQHDFLAPVAEEIGAQGRSRFGSVVRYAALGTKEHFSRFLFPVPLRDCVAVKQLAQQIAVPENSEVARPRHLVGYLLSLRAEQARQSRTERPRFKTAMTRIDVQRQPPARSFAVSARPDRRPLPKYLACSCVTETCAGVVKPFLNVINLESGTIGIEIRNVQRVTVSEARRIESLAIVIEYHRSKDDLVPSVCIDIGDTQLVIALPAIFAVRLIRIAVEHPSARQLSTAKVPRRD